MSRPSWSRAEKATVMPSRTRGEADDQPDGPFEAEFLAMTAKMKSLMTSFGRKVR
jgi:hypothetical protein